MTSELPPGAQDEILELIYGNQKIAACKRYMEMRGISLMDAKQFIEQLTDKLREESPEKFAAMSKSGCAGVLVLMAVSLSCALGGVNLLAKDSLPLSLKSQAVPDGSDIRRGLRVSAPH